MDAGAFSDKKVLEAAKGIKFFLIDGTKGQKPIQKNYEINSYPAVILCDPNGKAMDRIMSVVDADTVATKLKTLANECTWTLPWEKSLDVAMKRGAEEKKPVVVWVPDNKKSASLKLATFLYDDAIRKLFEDCVMMSGEYKRKNELATQLSLSKGGILMILDPTSDKPFKPVKRIRRAKSSAGLAKTLKKVIADTKLEIRVRR